MRRLRILGVYIDASPERIHEGYRKLFPADDQFAIGYTEKGDPDVKFSTLGQLRQQGDTELVLRFLDGDMTIRWDDPQWNIVKIEKKQDAEA